MAMPETRMGPMWMGAIAGLELGLTIALFPHWLAWVVAYFFIRTVFDFHTLEAERRSRSRDDPRLPPPR